MKRIAVLCGGWSAERAVSLVSGQGIFGALSAGGYAVRAFDLLPSRLPGLRRALPRPKTPGWAAATSLDVLGARLAAFRADLVFIALHGPGGEDGKLQGWLEMLGLPYTGSSQLASTLAMNKQVAKEVFRRAGIPVAPGITARRGEKLPAFRLAAVVKPTDQGSAIGVTIVRKAAQLRPALAKAWRHGEEALVERYIQGRELTVGVLGSRALPVVEIRPELGDFYDYRSKYAKGGSTHLCPAPIPAGLARQAQAHALAAHRALGCRGYSRTDMMLDRAGRLYVLETNTQPGMTPTSLLPDAAKAAGLSYLELLKEMMKP